MVGTKRDEGVCPRRHDGGTERAALPDNKGVTPRMDVGVGIATLERGMFSFWGPDSTSSSDEAFLFL